MAHSGNKDKNKGKKKENSSRKKRTDKKARGGQMAGKQTDSALSYKAAGSLAQQKMMFTVGSLEKALLKEFPIEDAESWDRTGLQVGESAAGVKKVAVALDPTVSAILEAASAGANVLVTHHPPYLTAPDSFAPESSVALSEGAGVYAAIQNHVALMDFHTTLDVSPRVARILPGMLGLTFEGSVIKPIDSSKSKGYGQICRVVADDGKYDTLTHLAARCTSVFGRQPRVWGNFNTSIRRVVTATGSAGNLGSAVLAANIDCLICGEIKYHDALALSEAGLSIIELGHDVNELPLVAVLVDTLARIGLDQNRIVVIDQSNNWHYPEAIRV